MIEKTRRPSGLYVQSKHAIKQTFIGPASCAELVQLTGAATAVSIKVDHSDGSTLGPRTLYHKLKCSTKEAQCDLG